MKVVLIGAGSVSFTAGLVADMILAPDLGPWELGLVDIEAQALETAVGLCRRMVESRDADVQIAGALDRRELLPGADLVICTVGVGGRPAWEADVLVPRKYGIYQPVGDSVMPGGISRAMRMIPVLVDIARDTQELCPEAMFVNYANPMTANCWGIREATGIDVLGLCHGVFSIERDLANFIGAPVSEVSSLAVGVNHLTFLIDFRWNGEDAWPLVREQQARDQAKPYDQSRFAKTWADEIGKGESFTAYDNPLSWAIFENYGVFPAPGDRHITEFFPEQFPGGSYHGKTLGVDAYSLENVIAYGDWSYANMRAQALGEKPLNEWLFQRGVGEHEQLIDILRSIKTDGREVFSVNLPNRGAVPNLPRDAVLELPAAATASGMRPLQMLDFPDVLAGIINRKLTATRLTVAAALAQDRDLFVEALLADGAVTSREIARDLAGDLLEAQRDYLPAWFSN